MEPAAAGADTLESRSVEHGKSCDPGHILALAHIFARPIVCYAAASVGEVRAADTGRTMSSYAASGARMSGIYLPCLLPPHACSRDGPILIAYSHGHFSAVVATDAAASPSVWAALGLPHLASGDEATELSLPVPLVDETQAPLPVLFPPASVDGRPVDEAALLASYLEVFTSKLLPPAHRPADGTAPPTPPTPLTFTRQRVPRDSAALGHASPADAYFREVWARRVAAAVLPASPRARQPSAASRQSSWEIVEETSLESPVLVPAVAVAHDDDAHEIIIEGMPVESVWM